MGDYSSLHIEGVVTRRLREPLTAFFADFFTTPTEEREARFLEVFRGCSDHVRAAAEHFVRQDRWTMTLFGAASYEPDDWEPLWEGRNKIDDTGQLRVISSSKNRETQLIFAKQLAPYVFETITIRKVTGYR